MKNNHPLKFLIDTGSNKNFISPTVINNKVCKQIKPITVTRMNKKVSVNTIFEFNPFPLCPNPSTHKFYVLQFHDFFDGLIGYETLQTIKAKIDSETNTLQLPNFNIKMKKKILNPNKLTVNAMEIKFINIQTQYKEGETRIEKDIKINESLMIPSGLYKIQNYTIFAPIQNISNSEISIPTPNISIEINNFNLNTPEECHSKNIPNLISQIRSQHLNSEEKKNLIKILTKHPKCFQNETEKLSFTNAVKHSIKTTDDIPVHSKSYRYPHCHKEEVQRQISKMLEENIIRTSDSPWSSPVWVVPKKLDASGKRKWRLVIDYRKLNEKTINDRYPMPDITDILDKLGRCNYFTTLDLTSGFHQIEVDPKDIPKTAFNVENGHYEFVRMPFGLKNAPATFQRVMDNVLREHIGKRCLVYMDDIIIYSTSLQEHIEYLDKILTSLETYNFKLQLDKCEFLCKEVGFLGHIITPEGIKPNPNKVEAIRTWPLPRNQKELRGFLGTIGYYRRFLKDLAKVVKPLTTLLQKDIEFKHTDETIKSFEKCKLLLTSSHILQFPDFSQPFILTTDASNIALGAVLSQGQIGKDRPVAYASRTLSKTEQNYSTIEKELLAILWATKYFRPYLYGKKFTLYTDHQPLTHAFGNKTTNSRLVRWRLDLAEYDYEIKYRPGKQNVVADGLSRIAINNTETDETVHSADTDYSEFIPMTEKPVNFYSNQIILRISNETNETHEEIFPQIHRFTITRPAFDSDIVIDIFRTKMNSKKINCINCTEDLIPILNQVYKNYFHQAGILKLVISQTLLEDITNETEQDELIRSTHERAHRGIEENVKTIYRKSFFPKVKQKVQTYINLCHECNKGKYDRNPYKIKLAETPIPRKPFEIIHVDIFISQPEMFLSAIDKLSKFGILIPIKSRSIPDIKSAFIKLLSRYGNPNLIVCDNEPSFKSIEIRGFLNTLGIEMYFTPANHSEVNGTVERLHSTISEIYRCIKDRHRDLSIRQKFYLSLNHYNHSIHSVTGLKPIELFYGIKEGEERPLNLELILENRNKIFDETIELLKKKQNQDKERHNKNKETEPDLVPGEIVQLRVQGIRKKTGDLYKEVQVKENNRKTFHDKNNHKYHKNKIKRKKRRQRKPLNTND